MLDIDFDTIRELIEELGRINCKYVDALSELESLIEANNEDGHLDNVVVSVDELIDQDNDICDVLFELKRSEDSLDPTLYLQNDTDMSTD